MPAESTIRVVLADDHAMVRQALARILEDSGRICVVAQAGGGQQAIEEARASHPHVMVLDYSLGDRDAPGVIEQLLREQPAIRILVLTVHENLHYAVRILESGAHGYVIKSAAVEELLDAIRTVYNGGIYVSPAVSSAVLESLRRPKRERVGLAALSQREFDFLRHLGAGRSLQECSEQMKISTSTASTYRARILEKLNLKSTQELIRYALEHQIDG
ncbi:MAG: response regulator transcription factor [Planctomycetaceae bacterium]